MRILSFGHIPTWAGGRQESGLANVIYQLAKHGSDQDGAEVTLVATDCFVPVRKDGKLTILGWTKSSLIGYMLVHPLSAARSFFKLYGLKKKYPICESMAGLYLKRILFEKSVRRVNPQVIHLHGVQAIWNLDLVPKSTKVAVTFHGMTGKDKNLNDNEILFNMERDLFLSKRVNEVFFICTQLVDSFKDSYGENGKNNIVIFNSYDNTQFYLETDKQTPTRLDKEDGERSCVTTLCTVASLSDRKGQMRVLSALSTLPDRKRFEYICIGGGTNEMAEKVNLFAKEHDIVFRYLGKMKPDSIRKHLYMADYMIMPSSSEGFGLTYLEAIACGVPVIMPRDIPIAHEKTLINEKNSILLEDSTDKSIAKVLGRINDYCFNSKEVAASIAGYTWNQIASQYFESFKKL